MSEAAAYRDAVRVVMREHGERLAAARGLVLPVGALAVGRAVPADLLASLRARVSRFDGVEVEQLGHAYEALLQDEDRRNAGAHYTPRALADEVVEHALAPLVEGLRAEDLLDLRILDIATGSGIFLLSAAEYLTGLVDGGPSLRQVITTCLYGADVDATTAEVCRLSLWLLAGDQDLPWNVLEGRVVAGDSLLDEPVAGRVAVDWTVLAPEVMGAGGFDAVIGNPPFLGVKNIRGAVGQVVRDRYAATLLDGESGRSDLVVFFLARATRLSRGVVGLVLPDAVSEGDSARFGPGRAIDQGFEIFRAETSRPWPSAAGVRIALLWLRRGVSGSSAVLDGVVVQRIGPHLGRVAASARGTTPAPDWLPHGHQATIVLGRSLVLTTAEADDLRAADPRIGTWIRDYLSGEDLVTRHRSSASRQVLDLGAVPLADLEAVPALADRLTLIRTERETQLAKYPQLVSRWWGFLNPVARLYEDLAGEPEAIAFSKHAKYIWPVIVGTGPVFSNGLIVYPSADRGLYAFLASTPHRLWAVDEGGSRLNESHRYNPSRLRATYPFPDSVDGARDAGARLAEAVVRAGEAQQVGVTELLNQVHGSAPVAPEIAAIRDAVVEVDRAVLAAHGIDEVLVHGLQVVGDRTRFGLDPGGEAAIKARLLER
ncbi:methylase of polypeptide subunit release factors [Marmoricola sp. OAE513]|uniref:Eco57I restriction-modification methylase domain-containing protein n=1 Tax=Marmoricola sp. OAE513 TaxID=2817894 RepID=UPI001AE61C3E